MCCKQMYAKLRPSGKACDWAFFRLQEGGIATPSTLSQRGPVLGPQRQVAGPVVGGDVEHTVQRWAVAPLRQLWSNRPRTAHGAKSPPPTSRPATGHSGGRCGRYAGSSEPLEVWTKRCAAMIQRPPIPMPRTKSFCGPPRASSRCTAVVALQPAGPHTFLQLLIRKGMGGSRSRC